MKLLYSAVAIMALTLLAAALPHDRATAHPPDVGNRQDDAMFGVTQKYCLYTGDPEIQTGARNAFNTLDNYLGGILNPTQFSESCAGYQWKYWVDEVPCGTIAAACAEAWGCTAASDGFHSYCNGGHIGFDGDSLWDQPGARSTAAHELGHLWGIDHLSCDHEHPTVMGAPDQHYHVVPPDDVVRHIHGQCWTQAGPKATNFTSSDLSTIAAGYSTTNVPDFVRLLPNGSPSWGTLYWYAADIYEEAWFIIDHKIGTGAWFNETAVVARDTESFGFPTITDLPVRPSTGQQQDCWRVKAWSNLWGSGSSVPSCITRPGLNVPVDGTLTQMRGYGTSELTAVNMSSEFVSMELYDGLMGFNPTLLKTCIVVAPGASCSYSYPGRGPGYWHSVKVTTSGGGIYSWYVDVN